MRNIVLLANQFFKLAQQVATVTPTATNVIPPKPQKNYKDRFNGLEGVDRETAIQQEAAKKGYTIVPKKRTPLDEQSVLQAIYSIVNKKYPDLPEENKKEFTITIATQIKLETGYKSCYNFNVGNYHALPFKTNIYWKGQVYLGDDPQLDRTTKTTYVNKDWFWRAYSSLEDGIGDWYALLDKRYHDALEKAMQGDVESYGRILGQKGYYTADVNHYTNSLKKIKNTITNNNLNTIIFKQYLVTQNP